MEDKEKPEDQLDVLLKHTNAIAIYLKRISKVIENIYNDKLQDRKDR